MNPIFVTCYVDPDLDGVAGSLAYAEFLSKTGVSAVAGILGEPHEEARYVLERFSISGPQKIATTDQFEKIVLVDASELVGLEGKVAPEKVIEIIDHRKVNDAAHFPNANIQIELVGAADTLVAEKFMKSDVKISSESAILLSAGIISNTLNFKATVTTDRDRAASAWLAPKADLPADFWKDLFRAKSDVSGSKLEEKIRHDFAWFDRAGRKVAIAQLEVIGARKTVEERTAEIQSILEALRREHDLDLIFMSFIDLEEECNYFIAPDAESKSFIEKTFGVSFEGSIAKKGGFIVRKQIVPLLTEYLQKS